MAETNDIGRSRKRQSMGPSSVVVQSTPVNFRSAFGGASLGGGFGGGSGGGGFMRRNNVARGYSTPAFTRPQGEAGKYSKETVDAVVGTRGKEKKDLSELNSKLAGHLENTRYLEACVKGLTEEIERLKKCKGYSQDRVRDEYKDELDEARATIANMSSEMAQLQAKNLSLEDKCETKDEEMNVMKRQKTDLDSQLQKMTQMIGDLEGECSALRRQLETMNRERDDMKLVIERLRDDNDRVRNDCEAARCKQIEAQNERDAVCEELQFERDAAEAEISELREWLEELRSISPQIQLRFKSELREVIQQIQEEYNKQLERITDEQQRRCDDQILSFQNAQRLDNPDGVSKSENRALKTTLSANKSKITDLERENGRLKDDIAEIKKRFEQSMEEAENEKADLRTEVHNLSRDLEDIMRDLGDMRANNLDMELEISCYRKLLESEEAKMARSIEIQGNIQSQGGASLASIVVGGPNPGSPKGQSPN